jgi:diaminopimelate epimerase
MTSGVPVTKMSGAGNDFVVLDAAVARTIPDLAGWTRRVCRRGVSVGADGVLVVGPEGPAVRVLFLNPDGGEAFCGNGSRCAARFAVLRGWGKDVLRLLTAAGEVEAVVTGSRVRLALPGPVDRGPWTGSVGTAALAGRRIVAGVPHLVLEVEDVATAPLDRWGPALAHHPAFGEGGTNVNVVASRADGVLAIRTWERGVEGETLSCGSGAVAGAHFAALRGGRPDVVVVPASGVPLRVVLEGPPLAPTGAILEGDARVVFEATLPEEAVAGFPA